MSYRILTDDDLPRVISMPVVMEKIEDAMREMAQGTLIAPPRFALNVENGALLFTAGAATGHEQVMGFRVYETIRKDTAASVQLVTVYDSETGAFKGMVIGGTLGAMRTGGIGGVAIKYMARPEAKTLGMIGTGKQARTQLEAAVHARQFETARVFSRTQDKREAFANEMDDKLSVAVEPVTSAEAAVRDVDVLICATNSRQPVFKPAWLSPGTHINTVGPKARDASEVEPAVGEQSAVIVSDSLAQVDAYSEPFFLSGALGRDRMIELSEIVAGNQAGRIAADDITLFCSVGLAGTEVVVANAALQAAAS